MQKLFGRRRQRGRRKVVQDEALVIYITLETSFRGCLSDALLFRITSLFFMFDEHSHVFIFNNKAMEHQHWRLCVFVFAHKSNSILTFGDIKSW